MAEVIFTHPLITNRDGSLLALTTDVRPDSIIWSYGLNTMNYDTYGGEVVQILSMYIDDMTIAGTTSSYSKMEQVYAWFLQYMQLASQSGHFQSTPVTFSYPHRGWTFEILPRSLPSFQYGLEVVTPTWTVQAAVQESPADVKDLIMENAVFTGMATQGGFDPFGKATAEIGYIEDNPWSGPVGKDYDADSASITSLANTFQDFISSWNNGDNKYLNADTSKPAWLGSTKTTKDATKAKTVLGSIGRGLNDVGDILSGK